MFTRNTWIFYVATRMEKQSCWINDPVIEASLKREALTLDAKTAIG